MFNLQINLGWLPHPVVDRDREQGVKEALPSVTGCRGWS